MSDLQTVPPDYIADQREAGWPDIHPEDYCHLCGGPNMSWYVSRDLWLAATARWAERTGREGICCPRCFADMYGEETGLTVIWELRPGWSSE